MSRFIHTYTLKQETPMIHFQHDQAGATLRASEVKPKLDRFLCGKLGITFDEQHENRPSAHSDWFIPGTKALNYKMRVLGHGTKTITKDTERLIRNSRIPNSRDIPPKDKKSEINEMYFANMPDLNGVDSQAEKEQIIRESCKEYVFAPYVINNGKLEAGIEIIVQCFQPSLMEWLGNTDLIYEFFLVYNFGSRQSKGFGGFTLTRIDDNDLSEVDPISVLISPLSPDGEEEPYHFFYGYADGDDSYTAMLNHACTVYACLKGGLNRAGYKKNENRYVNPGRYIKGYIQRKYLDDINSRDCGSDKAFIKTNVIKKRETSTERYGEDSETRERFSEYRKFSFVRALLGLADHYEFKDDMRGGTAAVVSGDGIDRFRSPITIKIVGDRLLFIFDKKPEAPRKLRINDMLKKKFMIYRKTGSPPLFSENVRTPAEFDVEVFIEGFLDYFNYDISGDKGILSQYFEKCYPYYRSRNMILYNGRMAGGGE